MSPLSKPLTTDATEGREPPVLHFKGALADITDEVRAQRRDPNKKSNWLLFDFNVKEVIRSSEPFNFPTYRIEMLELNIPGSGWEAFKKSVREFGYSGPIDGLIGRNFEMEWGRAILSLPKQGEGETGFENREGSCWLARSIEGVENTSGELLAWVIENVNGKNETEFKVQFTANAELRSKTGYQETLQQVMNGTLLTGLVSAGSLTLVDGVYHKNG
jgi:hypothetical protein